MHITSYDWVEGPQGQQGGAANGSAAGGGAATDPGGELAAAVQGAPRAARTVLDATLCAGDQPAVLFPAAGGNIHEFTALTDCAVLDLMSPPYSTGAR